MNKPKFTYTPEQLEYFRHCGRLGGMIGRKAKLTPERIKRMQDGRKKANKSATNQQ